MNFQQITERVADQIIDLPSGIEPLIGAWVNDALRAAEDRHNFRYMEATLNATTAPGTRDLISKPSRWKETRGNPFLRDNQGNTKEIRWASSELDMVREYDNNPDDDGEPRFVLEGATNLFVFPFSDGRSDYPDGQYRLRLPYWLRSATLTGAATGWMLTNGSLYLIYHASASALVYLREEQRAGGYYQLAEQEYQRVKGFDKRSRLPDTLTLTPRSGARVGTRRGRRI